MKILYYITPHGYGHAVRSCAICREFSPDVELIFRTTIPRKFFKEEIRRPFRYFSARIDLGCIQDDSITVKKEETLKAYMKISEENEKRLSEEVRWVLDEGVDGIVADIPPFAFEVAREAQVPSLAVSNFTWHDIYEPYCADYPAFQPYLEKIGEQYQMAGMLLELTPSTGMPQFPRRMKVPPVGSIGRNVRERLVKHLGPGPGKYLGLIYVGEFGMECIPWPELKKFTNWDFLGIYPVPGNPENYHLVSKQDFPYLDLVASVDLMVSKIGYGVFAQSLMHGTPLIYPPRDDFAEFPVLEKAILEWGHGYPLPREDYCALKWEEVLEEVIRRKRPDPQVSAGAAICAREIEKFIRTRT